MAYTSYSKIELDSTKWPAAFKRVKTWAVTEKVHGANFAFSFENGTISYGKRTGMIRNDESFFNYRSMLHEYEPKVQYIIEAVRNEFLNCQKIIVFGELFGGVYPNCELKVMPVQMGVYYSPDIHFYAFDIFIMIDNKGVYLDFEKSLNYFKAAGILHAEPLAVFNSYEKAAHYTIGFNTTIPAKFNLPPIRGNKAEGIVIRSMTERFVVKAKIREFAEEIYSDNTIGTRDKQTIAIHMMTENRLNNAISKIGPMDEYKYQIYELLCQDILTELRITNSQEAKALTRYIMDEIIKKFGP